MPLLAIIGIVITVIVWTQVSWVWGLVAGFFLIGGLGWKILASGAGAIIGRRNPGTKEFTEAWESRVGEMRFGQPATYPPPGAYQAWRAAHEREGISAGDWMDRAAQRVNAPKAQGLVSGLFETVGRWEGVAEAHPEGVFVIGERIWWEPETGDPENGQEQREPSDTVIRWDQIESATLTDRGLELKPITPSMIFLVKVTDFDDSGVEPWLRLVEDKGIPLQRKGTAPS
jgi:hypothetical protein